MLLLIVLLTALCGIIYELLLSSISSYLLWNSITQFSITIWFFLFGLGLGAYFSKKVKKYRSTLFAKTSENTLISIMQQIPQEIELSSLPIFIDSKPNVELSLSSTDKDLLKNILNFLNTQGNVSSMSNPKITTMNNQPAIFSSGEQLYYKILQSVSQVSSGGSATGQNEVVRSVFAGVLLDITPEITDNDEIILKINPSISSINGQV